MIAENPEIAGGRNRRFRKFRHCVFVGESLRGILRGKQSREFLVIEADEADVNVLLLQGGKLRSQEIVVPTCVQCELVVREDVSALLCVREVVEDNYRNLLELQLPRSRADGRARR